MPGTALFAAIAAPCGPPLVHGQVRHPGAGRLFTNQCFVGTAGKAATYQAGHYKGRQGRTGQAANDLEAGTTTCLEGQQRSNEQVYKTVLILQLDNLCM